MKLRLTNGSSFIVPLLLFTLFLAGCQGTKDSKSEENQKSVSSHWKVIGPGGGGGVLKPTISPFDENLVLTHCDMTAAYISRDGGENWKANNLWTVPEDFEFDPVDKNTIYVATRGYRHSEDRGSGLSVVYKSTDQGKRWRIIYPDVKNAIETDRLQNTDLLPSELIPGAFDATVDKIAVDPANNKRIYLGLSPLKFYMRFNNTTEVTKTPKLLLSTDGGLNWDLIAEVPGKRVLNIFPDVESVNGGVTVITESACVYVDSKFGKVIRHNLPVDNIIASEGGAGSMSNLIYIQSAFAKENNKIIGGMFVSPDLGKSWNQINNGLLKQVGKGMIPGFRKGLAVCESQPEIAYISTIDPTVKNKLWSVWSSSHDLPRTKMFGDDGKFEKSGGGVAFSEDGGKTWENIAKGIPQNACTSILIDENSPVNSRTMYVGAFGRGVYKTEDGGETWRQVFDERVRVNTAGMNPKQPNAIYINTFQNAAFRSIDFGETWLRIEGYRFKWGQQAVPDINNPGMLFLSTYGGSVYYGPAAGVPNAFEGIENMPKGWW